MIVFRFAELSLEKLPAEKVLKESFSGRYRLIVRARVKELEPKNGRFGSSAGKPAVDANHRDTDFGIKIFVLSIDKSASNFTHTKKGPQLLTWDYS